jgi:hypothetical protein
VQRFSRRLRNFSFLSTFNTQVQFRAVKLSRRLPMDTTTLLIILVILLVLGGGGFYGRGRWY